MFLLDILIFAVVVLVVALGYVLYRHADLRAQAQNLATAVLADAKAEAARLARKVRENA
jgi:uncharacterized membrane protein YvbJ